VVLKLKLEGLDREVFSEFEEDSDSAEGINTLEVKRNFPIKYARYSQSKANQLMLILRFLDQLTVVHVMHINQQWINF